MPKQEAFQAAAPEVRSKQSTAMVQPRQLLHRLGALLGQLENHTRFAASHIVTHYKGILLTPKIKVAKWKLFFQALDYWEEEISCILKDKNLI